MPSINKSVLLPYASEKMFDLVERVEDYPAFLPWCAATAVQRQDGGMVATIQIAFRGVQQAFTTRNAHRYPERISIELLDGPFRQLTGLWDFHSLAADACKVELALEYEMRAGVLGRALAPVFGHIAGSLIDAFVARADEMHG